MVLLPLVFMEAGLQTMIDPMNCVMYLGMLCSQDAWYSLQESKKAPGFFLPAGEEAQRLVLDSTNSPLGWVLTCCV